MEVENKMHGNGMERRGAGGGEGRGSGRQPMAACPTTPLNRLLGWRTPLSAWGAGQAPAGPEITLYSQAGRCPGQEAGPKVGLSNRTFDGDGVSHACAVPP